MQRRTSKVETRIILPVSSYTDIEIADAAEAQAKIKSEVPGKTEEFQKKGEAQAAKAGQQFDKAVETPWLRL